MTSHFTSIDIPDCPIEKSTLYVIGLPIGNLSDITLRALSVLQKVDKVYAEDTRVFRKLASHYKISVKVESLHQYNQLRRADSLIEELQQGKSLALVSDAGTPAISDPGALLVERILSAGLRVSPIPGPSSVISLVSISGLGISGFYFGGFLPLKPSKVARAIEAAINTELPGVFFESPHRIVKTLKLIQTRFPDSELVVAKELTKLHENLFRGSAQEVLELLDKTSQVRGEFCLIIRSGGSNPDQSPTELV